MDGKIRIFVVDDQTLVLEGVSLLLSSQPDFQVVGVSSTVTEALQGIQDSEPDLVLLDVALNGEDAAGLLAELPSDHPCKILLLTATMNLGQIARLLGSGASGVVSKATDCERLFGAIRQVVAGETFVDQIYLRPFLTMIFAAQLQLDERRLSVREQHIFAEVCRGKGNKEIASILRITEPSVKAGLQRLFQRFGATNRAQLVAAASEVGAGERGYKIDHATRTDVRRTVRRGYVHVDCGAGAVDPLADAPIRVIGTCADALRTRSESG